MIVQLLLSVNFSTQIFKISELKFCNTAIGNTISGKLIISHIFKVRTDDSCNSVMCNKDICFATICLQLIKKIVYSLCELKHGFTAAKSVYKSFFGFIKLM